MTGDWVQTLTNYLLAVDDRPGRTNMIDLAFWLSAQMDSGETLETLIEAIIRGAYRLPKEGQ